MPNWFGCPGFPSTCERVSIAQRIRRMAETSIEWTDTTWNPVAGCTVLTAGCTNCYAMRMASRLAAMGLTKYMLILRSGHQLAMFGARQA
jgi:protein gp37